MGCELTNNASFWLFFFFFSVANIIFLFAFLCQHNRHHGEKKLRRQYTVNAVMLNSNTQCCNLSSSFKKQNNPAVRNISSSVTGSLTWISSLFTFYIFLTWFFFFKFNSVPFSFKAFVYNHVAWSKDIILEPSPYLCIVLMQTLKWYI